MSELDISISNQYMNQRFKGIQEMLLSVHAASNSLTNESRGTERENFINLFLSNILPMHFRFGTGDVTDLGGNRSGQVDIVIEYPFLPSLSLPGTGSEPRLYIAEGVAAVIEVKSNLKDQWNQIKDGTSSKLKDLKRRSQSGMGDSPESIPLFAVGYKGWTNMDTLIDRLREGVVDGILVIDQGLFVWNPGILATPSLTGQVTGEWALWGFISAIHKICISKHSLEFDLALYARPDLFILKRLCRLVKDDDMTVPYGYFYLTDLEKFGRVKAKKILDALVEQNFISIQRELKDDQGITIDLEVSITETAKEQTQFMLLPF